MTNFDLEKELHRLPKMDPSPKFCDEAKGRLMHQILLDKNEKWFLRLLKRIVPVSPSDRFVQLARVRLASRIEAMKQPVIGWLQFTKRITASVLVMVFAVTTTLFFVDGKQEVNAAENTYLEIISGEAMVKHADRIVWDVIGKQTELSAGDLIRLGDSSTAVIHFFDDSEVRLAENSLLLLSRLSVSPGYARQGIIEASLHQGNAWVQTLNVDDGYAGFTLVTRDAIVSAINASFGVQANLFKPTVVRSFRHRVGIRALNQETRDVFASGQLNSFQQITLDTSIIGQNSGSGELSQYFLATDLSEEERGQEWVFNNQEADRTHLAALRERELASLRSATGALPGQVLYPVKRAKERLGLALSFGNESQTNTQIDIAKQRLNEAIFLIQQGHKQEANLALLEYQQLIRQIAEESEEESDREELASQVVVAHQKTLVAALPGDAQIGIVKEALDQAEELFAENPAKKAEIRLQNSLENLVQVQDLILAGDLGSAEKVLASKKVFVANLLDEVILLEEEDQQRLMYTSILDTQREQQRILSEINRELAGQDKDSLLLSIVKDANKTLDSQIKRTAAVMKPLLPDVVLSQAVILPLDQKVHEFVEKVNIYKTRQGQINQINRLLKKLPQYAYDIEFLTKARDQLDSYAKDIVNVKILQLKRRIAARKGKAVQQKINRSVKNRLN